MKPYYDRDGVTIYHGDARDVVPSLGEGCAGIVLTDPPFAERTHRGARTRTEGAESESLVRFDALGNEGFVDASRMLVRAAERWVVMFCDWRHAALLEPAGVPLVRLGVWVKPNSAPQLTGDRPATGWEAVALLHRPGRKRWNGGGGRAVWTFSRVDAVFHPTQKPLPLLARLLRLFGEPGETVLDPYMGAGSTLRAAMDAGMPAIGIEREEVYCEIAARRLEQGVFAWGDGA